MRKWFLLIAVTAILLGLWRGEQRLVLRKAATICLECIGLG